MVCVGNFCKSHSYITAWCHFCTPVMPLLYGEGNGTPLQYSFLENLMDRGAWGSWKVRPDWMTSLSLSLLCIGEGNGNPLQCSCLENPRDGVAQGRTRLKWLSNAFVISVALPPLTLGMEEIRDHTKYKRNCYSHAFRETEEGIHRAWTPSQACPRWSCKATSPVDSELCA